ncbi:MAG: RNA polymerase sigma factor [Ruminiclostridium sp.]|nr:RNA polymerase sigma factor [Ruminiclostridium sp.]
MNGKELGYYLEKYRNSVFAAALFYLKNPHDADDVLQDVFFRLYTYDGSFESEEHVKAWLIRCAINRSKNLLHSPWYRLSAPLEAAVDKIQSDNAGAGDDDVFRLLKKLGRRNRVALYLYYYEDYSTEEIAKMLGISTVAVTSRLKRGRKQLGKLIEAERNAENGDKSTI